MRFVHDIGVVSSGILTGVVVAAAAATLHAGQARADDFEVPSPLTDYDVVFLLDIEVDTGVDFLDVGDRLFYAYNINWAAVDQQAVGDIYQSNAVQLDGLFYFDVDGFEETASFDGGLTTGFDNQFVPPFSFFDEFRNEVLNSDFTDGFGGGIGTPLEFFLSLRGSDDIMVRDAGEDLALVHMYDQTAISRYDENGWRMDFGTGSISGGSVDVRIVPAPGAVGLVTLASLAGFRRRR